jgi:hypothetical protein
VTLAEAGHREEFADAVTRHIATVDYQKMPLLYAYPPKLSA